MSLAMSLILKISYTQLILNYILSSLLSWALGSWTVRKLGIPSTGFILFRHWGGSVYGCVVVCCVTVVWSEWVNDIVWWLMMLCWDMFDDYDPVGVIWQYCYVSGDDDDGMCVVGWRDVSLVWCGWADLCDMSGVNCFGDEEGIFVTTTRSLRLINMIKYCIYVHIIYVCEYWTRWWLKTNSIR